MSANITSVSTSGTQNESTVEQSATSSNGTSEYDEQQMRKLFNQIICEAQKEAKNQLEQNGKKVSYYIRKPYMRWMNLANEIFEQKKAQADPKTSEILEKYTEILKERRRVIGAVRNAYRNAVPHKIQMLIDKNSYAVPHADERSNESSDEESDDETDDQYVQRRRRWFHEGKSEEYKAEMRKIKWEGKKKQKLN